jgi:hypothetical protein
MGFFVVVLGRIASARKTSATWPGPPPAAPTPGAPRGAGRAACCPGPGRHQDSPEEGLRARSDEPRHTCAPGGRCCPVGHGVCGPMRASPNATRGDAPGTGHQTAQRNQACATRAGTHTPCGPACRGTPWRHMETALATARAEGRLETSTGAASLPSACGPSRPLPGARTAMSGWRMTGVIPVTARPRAQGRDRHVRSYQQRAGLHSYTVGPIGSGSEEKPGDTATTDHQDEESDDA